MRLTVRPWTLPGNRTDRLQYYHGFCLERRRPLTVFSAGNHCEPICYGQGCPLFDVVHPAFPLLTMAEPTLQGALTDGFGEAVLECDRFKQCKVSSPDSWKKAVRVYPLCGCSVPQLDEQPGRKSLCALLVQRPVRRPRHLPALRLHPARPGRLEQGHQEVQ